MKKRFIILYLITLILSINFVLSHIYSPPTNIRATDHSLIKKNGTYHLFYTYYNLSVGAGSWAVDPNADFFGHTTSPDLTIWTDQDNIINVGANSTWDSQNVWAPHVFLFNGTYYMFYTGVNYSNTSSSVNTQQLGIANSTDLYNWTKDLNNPIWNCSQASWAEWFPNQTWKGQCRDFMVFRNNIDNNFLMYYMAKINGTNHFIVGVANSTNLTTWIDSGNISASEGLKVESPFMALKDGVYYLTWTDNSGVIYANSTNPISGFVAQGLVPEDPAARGLASETPYLGNTYFYTTYGNTAVLDNKIEIRKLKFYPNGTISPITLLDCDILELDCHLDSDDESVTGYLLYTVYDIEEINNNLIIQTDIATEIYNEQECQGDLVCFWERTQSSISQAISSYSSYIASRIRRSPISCPVLKVNFTTPNDKQNIISGNYKITSYKKSNKSIEYVSYSYRKNKENEEEKYHLISKAKSNFLGFAFATWNTKSVPDGDYILQATYENFNCKDTQTLNIVIDNTVPSSNYQQENLDSISINTNKVFSTTPDRSAKICLFNWDVTGNLQSLFSMPDATGVCKQKIENIPKNTIILYNWSISDGLNWTHLENRYIKIQEESTEIEQKSSDYSKVSLAIVFIFLLIFLLNFGALKKIYFGIMHRENKILSKNPKKLTYFKKFKSKKN